ncbi:MAG: AMP-binding protein [Gammaproteobacteria bacterium]|nr:AMP-binding protein [Gammaproteobacteria bacterium]MDE0284109.1 AMP-binding protein [Gammaproteobacteria bacterium]
MPRVLPPDVDTELATLVFGERTCSAGDLDSAARHVAGGLSSLGICEDDAVAVILRNDIPYFIIHEASHYLGFDVVPVNWHLKPAEISFILADCQAKAVIVHSDLLTRELAVVIGRVPVIVVTTPDEITECYNVTDGAGDLEPGFLDWSRWVEESPRCTASNKKFRPPLFYTSGSSGRPKAVLRKDVTPDIVARISERTTYAWGFEQTPLRSVMAGPLYHSAPNGYANMVLQSGGILVLAARFNAEGLLSLIERHKITHLHLVPTMFVRLLDLPDDIRGAYRLDSLVHVTHGAAPCPADVKRSMINWWGSVIYEYYAMTETGIITCCSSAEWLERPSTVGRPAPGVEIEIRGVEGNRRNAFEEGLICVKHEGSHCISYRNADSGSAGLQQNGFLVTGDIGYLDDEGYLYISSRQSDMVICGGVNIYPAEIEEVLIAMDDVIDCVVFGIPDAEFGEKLVAVIQKRGMLNGDAAAAHLKTRIADFKVPRVYEFVDRLPREDSGKIKKQLIREDYLQKYGY